MSKRIYLTGKNGEGKITIVDDCDYEELNQWKWYLNKDGYVWRSYKKDNSWKQIRIHREILGLTDTKVFTDHINHDKLDNRRENLRACTNQENQRNSKKQQKNIYGKKCSSKYKGVCWKKSRNKWVAFIKIDNKLINLGTFISEIEAAKTYDTKAKELFKEFACINFQENK